MRIYPDPELPDLEVTWFAEECGDGEQVTFTLTGLDDNSSALVTAPCLSLPVEFKDLPRQPYLVDGTLSDAAGEVLSRSIGEADLRNGVDERVELYFNTSSPFQVAWTFDMGASCTSLAADTVVVQLLPGVELATACQAGALFGFEKNGTYTMRIRAVSGPDTVAISAESEPFTLQALMTTDLGTVTLSPCAPDCPEF